MNKRDGFRGLMRPKKISDCSKDRDEELSFFRDIQKRGKESVSLLQPVSDEFDANGNCELYRMESIGRKGMGLEFFGEATAKNDYNWLKTPPATPLFASLEMETNGQEMVMQKEIPILQPLSRFAGKDKSANTRSNTNSNPKIVPPRSYKTPNGRPIISFTDKKTMKTTPIPINQLQTIPLPKANTNPHTCIEETKPNFLASNLTKSMLKADTKPSTTNHKSRGVSPSVRPRIAAQVHGFLDETPANLRTTNRTESATRGRPSNQKASIPQIKQADTSTKARSSRQSCSPNVTRGRKAETDGKVSHLTANGTQVVGSRMVEKLMSARISNAEQRQGKMKMNVSMDEKARIIVSSCEERVGKIELHGSMNERPGFGMLPKSSLGMSSKHKEFPRDMNKTEHARIAPGRK